MHDIKTTNVLLSVNNYTRTTHVAAARNYDDVSRIELDKVCNLSLFDIKFDGIVDSDGRVRVADGSAVVCNNVGDTARANSDLRCLPRVDYWE